MNEPEVIPMERPVALVPVSRGLDRTDREQLDLLKRTIANGLDDDEFALFVQVCQHTDLDPFRRQIYAIKRWSNRERREVMTIQTGIDGYRAIAQRTGQHAGTDDAIFEGLSKNKQHPGKATVTVYKVIAGLRVPFTASARWDEYCPPDNQAAMWKRMGHNMLAKCAEALALRKAFPTELAGVDAEEAIAYDYQTRTIAPADASETEPTRAELVTQRYQALAVNAKVAYTAWLKGQEFARPPTDEQLDVIEAKLAELEGPTEPENDPPDAGDVAEAEGHPLAQETDESFDLDEMNGRFPPPLEPVPEGFCIGCRQKITKTGEHKLSEKDPRYGASCEPW